MTRRAGGPFLTLLNADQFKNLATFYRDISEETIHSLGSHQLVFTDNTHLFGESHKLLEFIVFLLNRCILEQLD